ncbi:PEP-CTERM sorting domain-containing protein [Massilia sp. DD77]|uniref:PEP-CTERM sorting domain-containing protein n=1 Tax=Massilia sp. DD77 TaxID=3109349 RepID=UPI002FFEFE1A
MSFLSRRACMFVLGLPALVLAEPVSVTTHSTGTSNVDSTILFALGLDSVTTAPFLPFELTLRSTFEPDAIPSNWAYNDGGEVAIDFRIGDQEFHYGGRADSSVNLYDQSTSFDAYGHVISFNTPGPPDSSYIIRFSHTLYYLPDNPGAAGPLSPLYADARDGVYGHYTIDAFPSYPDVPLHWQMSSTTDAMLSVQVGVVPEPAPFLLLSAGLLTLALRRRLNLGNVTGQLRHILTCIKHFFD